MGLDAELKGLGRGKSSSDFGLESGGSVSVLGGTDFTLLGGGSFLEGGVFPCFAGIGFLGGSESFPVSGGGFLQELEESGGVPGR